MRKSERRNRWPGWKEEEEGRDWCSTASQVLLGYAPELCYSASEGRPGGYGTWMPVENRTCF
ncbi:hypothetical protein E2C01_054346 [Portunus trituberculatus]|uniref:Uncharacterized protein n=1 Tax=Portunus trituberculatus TaxID=210409 RepID=A0A5B7GSH6_PORTR|nr:hypothetical protein [Portunus trituberculatus]